MLNTSDTFKSTSRDNFKMPQVILGHLDVSTQADIPHLALSYDSEDDTMGRTHDKNARPAHYSKQDIREQYCISNRGLGALENDKQTLFGCLSSHHTSSCSNRTSFLTACVRQKVPSDENLYELYKRHPLEYAPYPRRNRNPWGPLSPEIYRYDEDLKTSYFRRKIQTDPSRYTWMPTDDESIKMEKPKSIRDCTTHNQQCQSLIGSKKHVSFARSYTLASFDDAISSLSTSYNDFNKTTTPQERLLDVRKTEILPITKQPESENIVVVDKVKRTLTKTQATQTDAGLTRKILPSNHVTLSPKFVYKVEMVSQEAQTNGFILNGRKLMKSFSEAGSKFGISYNVKDQQQIDTLLDHEPLQRTQSDEPPRSPFIVTTPPAFATSELSQQFFESDTSSLSKSDPESEDSTQSKKEIFIDFKPQITQTQKASKRLTKTLSDGEILLDQKKIRNIGDKSQKSSSVSHENMTVEDQTINFTPYFQKTPIKNEGIYKNLDENIYSSLNGGLCVQDSIDEEFHENLIYDKLYLGRENGKLNNMEIENHSPYENNVVPFVCLLTEEKISPFASNDSLTNGTRDQSDGIWNESQSTVLQLDSGTDSGTLLSSSELTSAKSSSSTNLLTPSSRRKHLLMLQHQQRSSMDTEALDEETVDTNVIHPRITVEKSVLQERLAPTPRQYLSAQKSHIWKKTPDSPAESPIPAVVPDLLLARTDSCKTNTDISESTTTDDYITANSGTDSSRKSGSIKGIDVNNLPMHTSNEGFEHIKDAVNEDMVVPTLSTEDILISPNSRSCCNTPVSNIRTGRSTPSEYSSSSCGSYSVGSIPDLLEKSKVPSEISGKVASVSNNVFHNSCSRYRNSSPANDELTWKYSNHNKSDVEEFSLDLSINQHIYSETYVIASRGKHKTSTKELPSRETNRNAEKTKRSKSRLQCQKKSFMTKKMIYKEGPISYDENIEKVTSDESSCDLKQYIGQTSPRKIKKSKEVFRRKSLPRSPVTQRISSKHFDEKPSSLPGSLSRKKSSKHANKNKKTETGCLSPISFPLETKHTKKSASSCSKLKALSAESLRSVSPGSDSVFYSDPSNHTADNQIHCLHCGKEVDIITTVDSDKNNISENRHGIVQPPAEFEDSPRGKASGRLYKKLDRRIKSEERSPIESGKHNYKTDIRAKSEERGAKTYKNKLRPMAKSTNNSQEQLKATDSSPSILPGAPEEEDDNGIYDISYYDGYWVHIDERDEINSLACNQVTADINRRSSISSTESEQEFRKRYQAVTHRMVHRKSCIEMYKRQNNQSFECDKTVIVHREAGEFGFRIHGSKPVVVSAIEPGTPAETSGLEVGDIVLSVNGVSVLDKTHSEVVKIAHAGSDTLKLEVIRTCHAFNPPSDNSSNILYNGYLWKLKGYASGSNTNDKWIRRWFSLKENNCLYYYKTDNDKQPVGVVTLSDHEVKTVQNYKEGCSLKPNQFIIQRPDEVPLHLAADTTGAQERWMEVLEKAIHDCQIIDNFLEGTKRNLMLPPSGISQPDCFGYLIKLGTQWKSWSRRYCVLKDACLYFYYDINAKSAFGVTYLHGYKVQQCLSGNKKNAFEIIPPDSSKKYFYFHTESDTDRKRWIAALEYSIDRWLKIGGNNCR